MKRILIPLFLTVLINYHALAQKSSLFVLGDVHYDLIEDHDMTWLSTKPGDLRQVKEDNRQGKSRYNRTGNCQSFSGVLYPYVPEINQKSGNQRRELLL